MALPTRPLGTSYSPMHSGLLTDSFTAERVASLPDDDWPRHRRHLLPRFERGPLRRRIRVRGPIDMPHLPPAA
jgi:hypothetical protein